MSESEYQELMNAAVRATDEFYDDELKAHTARIQEFTEEERWVIYEVASDWRLGMKPGSFSAVLIDAVFMADSVNLHKLRKEYTALVDAVYSWKSGNLYARLQAARQQRKESKP